MIRFLRSLFTHTPRFRVRYEAGYAPSAAASRELIDHESRPQTYAAIQRMVNRHGVEAVLADERTGMVTRVRPEVGR